MSKSRFGRFGQTTRRSKNSKSRPQQFRRGMFEELESRMVLSTSVGIGTGPVIVSFDDPNATASTVYTPKTTDPDVQVTLLHTTLIRMQVHTVNSDGSTGTQGEMDFLLLDDYAPVNIAHIESLISSGFYDGLTFHRIIQDFMIQGGDPTGTGGGGSGPNNTVVGHDDEFSTDLRFTTSGLLALANSGTDTNDCQFFITAAPYRDGDFQYTIIGKLVAGDNIRQAIANVPVEVNGQGEDSKPVNPPIIDSVTIDTTSNEYGLVLLTSASGATAGETSNVSVATSDNSTVTLTGSDGATGAVLATVLATDTPSIQDRPAFIAQTMPDVHTTMNTPVTFPIAVVQGDPGVALAYGAEVGTSTTDLTCNSASDGSANATATPSGNILGVYDLVVGVHRDSTSNSNTNWDTQHVALFVQPLAPTSLTLTTPAPGNQLSVENGLTFHVNGVTPGVTVDIFVDNGTTLIGSGVASGTATSVDIVTTVPVIDGTHTFVAEQEYDYSDTTVGNRTIPAGTLYSNASPTTGKYVFDTPPTAVAVLDDVKKSDTGITFVVTYSNPGNTIAVGSLGDNNIQVNNVNGFQANAQFVIDTVSDNGATVRATYAFDAPDGTWDANDLVRYSLTMLADQVRNVHGDYVATGILLVFNPLDLTDLTVTVDKASDQADPALTSPINFVASFNKTVADFTASGVTISGTAGATTAIVTPVSGSNGASYTIAISGMTQDGTVIVSLAAGVAHDAAGNPNDASTSTDNTVTFEGSPNGVTINQATGQADPTTASTIHFTVVFDIAVTDFTASDVTLSGTVLGNLVATITATDTTTYDVAVTGMTSSGTVIASIPAGVAHDPLGVGNAASTSTDNTVHFVLAAKPTFRLLAPTSGTFNVGQTIVIAWSDTNIISGTEISLCYDIDKTPNGNEHWIEIDQVAAANGIGTYSQWDTSNVAPGTYYIGGYLFSGKAIRSYCATPITIVAPKPTFRLTTPTSGTYNVGQTVIVTWAASNMASNATVSLCYDTDTVFNHNEKYFEVDQAPAINSNLSTAGYGAYGWDTTGVKPGTYYIGGYLWSNGKPTWSHLTQPITIVDPTPTFRVTAPTSGSYMPGQNVDIYWIAHNFADGSTVSLFYDKDTVVNGNEHYIEVDQVTLTVAKDDNKYESYVWAVPSLAPGQYYIGGYIWSNGKPTFSHLTQPITITAAPLMVDASSPPSAAAASLTAAQLQPIVVEAERRLTAATGIQVAAAMSGVSVQIGNLPADMLGEAAGSSIEISRTAAGYGWFVDPTPSDDSEFSDPLGPYALAAPASSPAANRVDLLTTVMHEMSHILGFGHDDSLDLMNPTLPLGERRFFAEPSSSALSLQSGASSFGSPLAETSAVDQVFASTGDTRSWALT